MNKMEQMMMEILESEGVLKQISESINIDPERIFDMFLEDKRKIYEKNRERLDLAKKESVPIPELKVKQKEFEDPLLGGNAVEVGFYYVDGLKFNPNDKTSRKYAKFRGAFNAANNYSYSVRKKNTEDVITSLTYQSLLKLLMAYRAFETFAAFLNATEGIEPTEVDGYTETEIIRNYDGFYMNKKEFKKELEKIMVGIIQRRGDDNIMEYISQKSVESGRGPFIYPRSSSISDESHLEYKTLTTARFLRNAFVHSSIAASSKNSAEDIFVLSDTLSKQLLISMNEFILDKFLKVE